MSTTFGVIVGIDNEEHKKYRVLSVTVNIAPNGVATDWNFSGKVVNEYEIIRLIMNNIAFLNARYDTEKKRLAGKGASLSRFDQCKDGIRPVIILAELVDSSGAIVGYKVANYYGKVMNISLRELLAFCSRASAKGIDPIQNAIYVSHTDGKKNHIRNYAGMMFVKEVLETPRNPYTQKRRAELKKNEGNITGNLSDIYEPDQIKQLALGKKNGVDIRVYANPKLSAEQMQALRRGMEKGLNVKPFAFPEYPAENMALYCDDLKYGMNIFNYLNPKYNVAQLFELSSATELGLNISSMCDPKIPAIEMEEIKQRLQNGIYKEVYNKEF